MWYVRTEDIHAFSGEEIDQYEQEIYSISEEDDDQDGYPCPYAHLRAGVRERETKERGKSEKDPQNRAIFARCGGFQALCLI